MHGNFFLLVMEFGGSDYGLYLCRFLILLETIIHFNAGVTTTSASGRCMEFFFLVGYGEGYGDHRLSSLLTQGMSRA